jgi:hypothetical protein
LEVFLIMTDFFYEKIDTSGSFIENDNNVLTITLNKRVTERSLNEIYYYLYTDKTSFNSETPIDLIR